MTSLIEEEAYQSIYGADYASLGEWLHADSMDLTFLLSIHTDLIEYGTSGIAFYDAMSIWAQSFF